MSNIKIGLRFYKEKFQSLYAKNIKVKKIGSNDLVLHVENKHENEYYQSDAVLDNKILDAFVIENGVVVDLGANIGYISAKILERKCKKLYAVEPVKGLFKRLEYLKIQDKRLEVFNCAVGEKAERKRISLSRMHNQGNSLNPLWKEKFKNVFGNDVIEEEIEVIPFSELPINENVDYIKIDVEGFECEFIRGAKAFFSEQRPLLQMEIYDFLLEEVLNEIQPYYEDYKRVVLLKNDILCLLDDSELYKYKDDVINENPPTYLFYNKNDLSKVSPYFPPSLNFICPAFPIGGNEYLIEMTNKLNFTSVLDIGVGNGCASFYFSTHGKAVTALGLSLDSYEVNLNELRKRGVEVIETDFELFEPNKKYDAIWMSHVLEHTQNVGLFLKKAHSLLNQNGWLFVMVPPHKHEVVGGHLTNGWNLGQLMYNLLVSGYNIKNGHFIKYGYNLCAFVKKDELPLPVLRCDNGDIETTKTRWPLEVFQGFNGELEEVNWFK